VTAPRKFRIAWWTWQLTALALVELVVILFLVKRIIEGGQVVEPAAFVAFMLVADVVLFLLLRRAARQGEFRDYDNDEMARLGCTCSWNSGERTQADPACPSHDDGSG
jgi:hypothetical protein